jgi:hypothetical protein
MALLNTSHCFNPIQYHLCHLKLRLLMHNLVLITFLIKSIIITIIINIIEIVIITIICIITSINIIIRYSYLIPADKGVLNSNITEFFETSNEADTISLILLSIFVNSASFAAVTPNLVLKKMLPKAPCRCKVEENGKR